MVMSHARGTLYRHDWLDGKSDWLLTEDSLKQAYIRARAQIESGRSMRSLEWRG